MHHVTDALVSVRHLLPGKRRRGRPGHRRRGVLALPLRVTHREDRPGGDVALGKRARPIQLHIAVEKREATLFHLILKAFNLLANAFVRQKNELVLALGLVSLPLVSRMYVAYS